MKSQNQGPLAQLLAKLRTKSMVRMLLLCLDRTIRWTRRMTVPGFRRVSIYDFCTEFYDGAKQGAIWQRAKGLSYSFLMAMPPLMIFFFTLIAYFPVDGAQDVLLGQLEKFIPQKIYCYVSLTVNDVMGHKHSQLRSLGFLTSIFLAATGIYGMLRSMNYANTNVERRPFLPVFGISLLLVPLLYVVILLVVVLMVGYRFIIDRLHDNNIINDTTLSSILVQSGRWFIMIFLILMVLAVFYYFAQGKTLFDVFRRKKESEDVGFGLLAPGSILATTLFFILTWGMQIYINKINRFNLLYGSIGTLLVAMFWLFMNCWVLLIGYQINVSIIGGLKHHKYALVDRRWSLRSKNKSVALSESDC